ncbi:hypothetical protein GPECTOR_5g357 [Gonium pectorale]|uniref:Peroxisomal membrane protein MPV17 n=1 Tax=Gonium pectorale TaxID=33097 RepID=A0A150GX59_GONPE|nr:hypothetical protein GPECTOR_5g357 [Gonium pectorale]|eukprot:KXZ54268.1 hypothetical protein GPECTOR_5g357 [Gonium pectorale]
MAAALTVSGAGPFNRAWFSRAWNAYETQLRKRPVLTQAMSSALLWGVGDGMAQRIERGGRGDVDARRVAMTAAFGGALIGPAGHCWYQLLEHLVLKLGLACSTKSMLLKVAVDNLLYSPCYVFVFFAYGCLAIDGLSREAFTAKLRSEFVPTMLAEALVWPPYMAAVFSRVPVQHQLLAVNIATLFDVCFLSWARTRNGEAESTAATATAAAEGAAREAADARERQRQGKRSGAGKRRVQEAEASGAGSASGGGGDWLSYGAQAPQDQPPPRSAAEARRRELAACLWDATPQPSLGHRALMAASATCNSTGNGGGIFW